MLPTAVRYLGPVWMRGRFCSPLACVPQWQTPASTTGPSRNATRLGSSGISDVVSALGISILMEDCSQSKVWLGYLISFFSRKEGVINSEKGPWLPSDAYGRSMIPSSIIQSTWSASDSFQSRGSNPSSLCARSDDTLELLYNVFTEYEVNTESPPTKLLP